MNRIKTRPWEYSVNVLPRQVQKHLFLTNNLCTSTFELAELKILTKITVQRLSLSLHRAFCRLV